MPNIPPPPPEEEVFSSTGSQVIPPPPPEESIFSPNKPKFDPNNGIPEESLMDKYVLGPVNRGIDAAVESGKSIGAGVLRMRANSLDTRKYVNPVTGAKETHPEWKTGLYTGRELRDKAKSIEQGIEKDRQLREVLGKDRPKSFKEAKGISGKIRYAEDAVAETIGGVLPHMIPFAAPATMGASRFGEVDKMMEDRGYSPEERDAIAIWSSTPDIALGFLPGSGILKGGVKSSAKETALRSIANIAKTASVTGLAFLGDRIGKNAANALLQDNPPKEGESFYQWCKRVGVAEGAMDSFWTGVAFHAVPKAASSGVKVAKSIAKDGVKIIHTVLGKPKTKSKKSIEDLIEPETVETKPGEKDQLKQVELDSIPEPPPEHEVFKANESPIVKSELVAKNEPVVREWPVAENEHRVKNESIVKEEPSVTGDKTSPVEEVKQEVKPETADKSKYDTELLPKEEKADPYVNKDMNDVKHGTLQHRLLLALRHHTAKKDGLGFVPDIVKEILNEGKYSKEEIHDALLALGPKGSDRATLQIESGIGLLTKEQADLSPTDKVQGFPLSWVQPTVKTDPYVSSRKIKYEQAELNRGKDAIQEQGAKGEVPRNGEGGEDISRSGEGVRPIEQGKETTLQGEAKAKKVEPTKSIQDVGTEQEVTREIAEAGATGESFEKAKDELSRVNPREAREHLVKVLGEGDGQKGERIVSNLEKSGMLKISGENKKNVRGDALSLGPLLQEANIYPNSETFLKANTVTTVMHEIGSHIHIKTYLGVDGWSSVKEAISKAYDNGDKKIVDAWNEMRSVYGKQKGFEGLELMSPGDVSGETGMLGRTGKSFGDVAFEEFFGRIGNEITTAKYGILAKIKDELINRIKEWLISKGWKKRDITYEQLEALLAGSFRSAQKLAARKAGTGEYSPVEKSILNMMGKEKGGASVAEKVVKEISKEYGTEEANNAYQSLKRDGIISTFNEADTYSSEYLSQSVKKDGLIKIVRPELISKNIGAERVMDVARDGASDKGKAKDEAKQEVQKALPGDENKDLRRAVYSDPRFGKDGVSPSGLASSIKNTSNFKPSTPVSVSINNFKNNFKSILAPSTTSLEATRANDILAKAAAESHTEMAQVTNAMGSISKIIDSLDDAGKAAIMDAIENPNIKLKDEGLSKVRETIRDIYDGWWNRVKASGLDIGYIENYLPHMFKNPEEAQRVIEQARVEGRLDYIIKRNGPDTYAVARDLGLEPAEPNAAKLVMRDFANRSKFMSAQKALGTSVKSGLVVKADSKAMVPQGWVELDNSINRSFVETGSGKKGKYYAPPEVALIFKNHFATGFEQGQIGPIYKAARTLNNAMAQAELALSAYHGMFISRDIASSMLGNTILDVVRHGPSIQRFKNIATAMTPVLQQHRVYKRGSELYDNIVNKKMTSEYDTQLLKDLEAGGYRTQGDAEYYNNMRESLKDSWNKMKDDMLPRHIRALYGIKSLGQIPFDVFETAAKPIMQYYVPRSKLAVFETMRNTELQSLPKNATEAQRARVMRKIWDSVEDRMGQLTYDNIGIHKKLKQAIQLSMLSFGWNLGSQRAIAGTMVDSASAIKMLARELSRKTGLTQPDAKKLIEEQRAAQAQGKYSKKDYFTNRMAYAAAEAFMTVATSGIIGMGARAAWNTFLKDDKEKPSEVMPTGGMDFLYTRTGPKDYKGRDVRKQLPGYAKEAVEDYLIMKKFLKGDPFAVLDYAKSKASPLVKTVIEHSEGKDWKGKDISENRIEDLALRFAPIPFKQADVDWTHVGKKILMGEFGDAGKDLAYGSKGVIPAMVGITDAKRSHVNSDAENKALEIYGKQQPSSTNYDKSNRRDLVTRYKKQLSDGYTDRFDEAVKNGELTPSEIKEIRSSSRVQKPQLDVIIKNIKDPDDALEVWEAASPEERARIKRYMFQHRAKAIGTSTRADRNATIKKWDTFLREAKGK